MINKNEVENIWNKLGEMTNFIQENERDFLFHFIGDQHHDTDIELADVSFTETGVKFIVYIPSTEMHYAYDISLYELVDWADLVIEHGPDLHYGVNPEYDVEFNSKEPPAQKESGFQVKNMKMPPKPSN